MALVKRLFQKVHAFSTTADAFTNRIQNAHILRLVDAYRTYGHNLAAIDPLKIVQSGYTIFFYRDIIIYIIYSIANIVIRNIYLHTTRSSLAMMSPLILFTVYLL